MAIEIEEATPFESLLHYGLFLGAIFQLVCIFAVIFIPKSDIDQDSDEDVREASINSKQATQQQTHHSSKKNKKERKKNR